ncbi:MAG: glycosyltransferase [Chryseolinea sp.]
MISLVVSLIFAVYVSLVVVLIVGWRLASRKKEMIDLQNQPLVSIIIPARNEENTITLLLSDISAQSYQHFELIVVDDHSQDATIERVEKEVTHDSRFIVLKSNGIGKKQALTTAIRSAKGSIIITTDADCRVNKNWVNSILPYFSDNETRMVFGGVKISCHSFFDDVQALEFASLIGSGAATSALGFPTMCNGANLAFRKDVFEEVDGYSGNMDVPSGDDEFLMRKIKAKYPKGIVFAGSSETVVSTAPSLDLKAFMHQRIRWAGKWKHNQSMASMMLAFFILLFQASTIALPILMLSNQIDSQMGSVLFMAKILVEYIFLQQVSSFLLLHWSWKAFILLQGLYPFYVVTIGLLSNFLSFSWKGRTLKSLTVKDKD